MRNYALREGTFEGLPLVEVRYAQDHSRLEREHLPFHRIVIHHAGSRDYTIDELIDLHMGKNKMGAIGYHFVIDAEGQLYYTRSIEIKGAHAYPNSGKLGIAFLRSFDTNKPNLREISALKRFTGTLAQKAGLPVFGHNQDQILEFLKKYPHMAAYDEIIRRLWEPSSVQDFEKSKEELTQELSAEEIAEIHDGNKEPKEEIQKIKTCPGIMAYRGMMQHVRSN